MPSNRHYAKRFTHKQMKDSKSEIRLLKMLLGGNENEDCLQYSIVTENFRQLPDFVAISYTWGARDNQQIVLIDNMEHFVHRNCHYALEQTYRQWRKGMIQSDLLWIDSICINQKDKAEKSLQVSLMGEIYSKATEVLACVGPHMDDSEFLVEKASEIAEFQYDCSHGEEEFLCQDCRLPWERWALALGIECLSRLCYACQTFGRRVYWTRVWIIQETAMARSLRILSGSDMLPWTACKNLEDFLAMELDENENLSRRYEVLPSCENNQMHEVFRAKEKRVPIDEIFSQFAGSECYELPDRLYGLLGLIEWPDGVEPILPDYDRTTFDIAVRRLIGKRRELKEREGFQEARSAAGEFKAMHEIGQENNGRGPLCGLIELDQNGNITTNLVKENDGGFTMPHSPSESEHSMDNLYEAPSDSKSREQLESDMASFLSSISSELRPRVIMLGSEAAGLVCKNAREGDILVPLLSNVFLLLRQSHDEIFDVIGQAILLQEYELGRDPRANDNITEEALFWAQVELKVTAEDAVLLFAQDRDDLDVDDNEIDDPDTDDRDAPETIGSGNQEDHWGRVLTGICGASLGAARITMQTPMLTKDVVVENKPSAQEAYSMREWIRTAHNGVAGRCSEWVVGSVDDMPEELRRREFKDTISADDDGSSSTSSVFTG
ncbi:hypothetical protein LTR37_007653 [Vermiconidia calcicola]|uniref:Uncharacterized protein n=1 Tax=Vermiconidia calcicola TaxID=1690605 RepID=A0ACC3NE00_9PEZI|nr:hypothetical protein LTR37_007653 [Vermiconidia calcicola]